MTEEYSYEAKTWDPTAKSHTGNWRGENFMLEMEAGLARMPKKYDVLIAYISMEETFDNLILVRWQQWLDYFNADRDAELNIATRKFYVGKFIGLTWMRQAEANCPDGKLPIVVVHQMGARHKQDIVMIRESYFDSLVKAKKEAA